MLPFEQALVRLSCAKSHALMLYMHARTHASSTFELCLHSDVCVSVLEGVRWGGERRESETCLVSSHV